jgi:heme exporter protein B
LNSFLNNVKAIFVKDLVSEFRGRQTLPVMIMLGVLIAWIFRIAAEGTSAPVTASAVILVSLLFSAVLAAERGFAVEKENDCINALLLAPMEAGDIFAAKLLAGVVMLCISQVIAVPITMALFGVNVNSNWFYLIITLLLINVGTSSIAALLGCATEGTKMQNSLLSVLVMAVLLPMMIPSVFALRALFGDVNAEVAGSGVLAMVGDFKRAIGFLAAFDAIFVTLCWLLFDFVIGGQEK